jgi:capsular polysaccharide biosynthesis protein
MENNNNDYQSQMMSLQRPSSNNDGYEVVEEEKEGISLGQVWHMIVKHWVALVIMVLVGLACGFGYSKFIKTPKYQANVQLMTVNGEASESSSTSSNISLAIQKTTIAYGYATTDEVVKSVGKKMAEKDYDIYLKDADGKKTEEYDLTAIKKLYSVSIPTVTGSSTSIFLSITSTCKTEAMAIDVANFVSSSIVSLSNDSSSTVYSMLKNSLVSMGTANSAKDTSTSTFIIALVGMLAGAVIGAAYGIIRELCNTKVSSKADLETLTGFKVIGMIPKYDNNVVVEMTEKKEEDKGGKENA